MGCNNSDDCHCSGCGTKQVQREATDYDNLVENIKRLLEVVEAPSLDSDGDVDIIRKERAQYFNAKKAICEIIFKA